MSTIRINDTGIEQIRQFLATEHKLGGDHFDAAMLRAWASDAEDCYAAGNGAQIEIKPWDAWRGHAVTLEISESGYDVEPTEISISTKNLRGQIAPLYCRYQSETNAQDAYIEMTEAGRISAGYSGEIGGGVPETVWHKCTLRWSVPSNVRGDELADLLESAEVIALFERVYLGHSVERDGNNHVGRLDDDAAEANDELSQIFERELNASNDGAGVWDAREWMDGAGLLAWWSGKTLEHAVADVEAEAESENVYLDGDIEEELLDWAESCINHPTEYTPTLDAYHLRALLDDGRIDADEATEYAAENGIEQIRQCLADNHKLGGDHPETHEYQYMVADGDGNSGPSEWGYPDEWPDEIEAESPEAALDELIELAVDEAEQCGAYYDGDQITCYIYHDGGTESRTITLDLPDAPRPDDEDE